MSSDKEQIEAAVAELANGRAVTLPAVGGSMRGRIEPGQNVTFSPVDPAAVHLGDIILVRWRKGGYLAHLVKEIDGTRFLLANTRGKVNGWVDAADILGIVTDVRDA